MPTTYEQLERDNATLRRENEQLRNVNDQLERQIAWLPEYEALRELAQKCRFGVHHSVRALFHDHFDKIDAAREEASDAESK